jgi:hypothetical protein
VFPQRRSGFYPRSSHVGFVVNKVALSRIFFQYTDEIRKLFCAVISAENLFYCHSSSIQSHTYFCILKIFCIMLSFIAMRYITSRSIAKFYNFPLSAVSNYLFKIFAHEPFRPSLQQPDTCRGMVTRGQYNAERHKGDSKQSFQMNSIVWHARACEFNPCNCNNGCPVATSRES